MARLNFKCQEQWNFVSQKYWIRTSHRRHAFESNKNIDFSNWIKSTAVMTKFQCDIVITKILFLLLLFYSRPFYLKIHFNLYAMKIIVIVFVSCVCCESLSKISLKIIHFTAYTPMDGQHCKILDAMYLYSCYVCMWNCVCT